MNLVYLGLLQELLVGGAVGEGAAVCGSVNRCSNARISAVSERYPQISNTREKET